MATEEKKILHIEAILSSISNTQIAVEPTNDPDLGFRMWGGKDDAGNVTKWLAKSENAYIDELRLEGATTIGDIGMLKHDASGNVTGGKITVDYFNTNILSDGPIGGGDVLGSGTANTLAMWTDTDTIGDSTITKSSNLYSVNAETSSHGGAVTNGIVLSQIEANGSVYLDNNTFLYGAAYAYTSLTLQDDVPLIFGSSQAKFEWDTNQTPDSLMLGLGATSNAMMLCQLADIGTDYALGPFTDPTLVMKAAGTTAAERTEFSHGLINAASGDFQINANNLIYDVDPNSHSLVETYGVPTANFICGEGHTIDGEYTHHSAIFGETITTNADHAIAGGYEVDSSGGGSLTWGYYLTNDAACSNVTGQDHSVSSNSDYASVGGENVAISGSGSTHNFAHGQDLVITGHHSGTIGDGITTAGDYNLVCGHDIDVDAGCDYNSVSGKDHALESTQYATVGGLAQQVFANYGLTFGANNYNNKAHTIVHGNYARPYWAYSRAFSSCRLDGATTGISQCFDSTMLCRHTESTDTVMLTFDGTGSTHPLAIPEGSQIGFLVSVHAAYEATGNGYEHTLRLITVSNSNGDIPRIASTEIASNYGGTYGFTLSWSYDETNDLVALNVAPENAAAANIVVHVLGGTKLKSEQSCS